MAKERDWGLLAARSVEEFEKRRQGHVVALAALRREALMVRYSPEFQRELQEHRHLKPWVHRWK